MVKRGAQYNSTAKSAKIETARGANRGPIANCERLRATLVMLIEPKGKVPMDPEDHRFHRAGFLEASFRLTRPRASFRSGRMATVTARKLEQAGDDSLSRGSVTPAPPISLRPGKRLVREWRGVTHMVLRNPHPGFGVSG
jgi:hypothetical protein